jgi:signal transduction histidine kinase/predicted ATPase
MAGSKTRSLDRRNFWVACFVTVALCVGPLRASVADDTLQVVLLYSYKYDRFLDPFDDGVSQTLQSGLPGRVQIFDEFFDTSVPESEETNLMTAYLRQKYAGRRVDLVIAAGSLAISFLAQRRDSLFPHSPLIFVGSQEIGVYKSLGPEASGIVTRSNPVQTVELALQLQPDAKRMVVVTGTSAADRQLEDKSRQPLSIFSRRLKVDYWSGFPTAELSHQLGTLPYGTFVLYLPYSGPPPPEVLRPIARKLAAAASVPVYTTFFDYTGDGVVGGAAQTLDEIGRQTGALAIRILTAHASNLRLFANSVNIVDWRQLQRWGLSEANLPPGTIVRFRPPPSLWEDHKGAVLGAVAALAVQALLIAALIVLAMRRQRAQAALEQQQQELAHLARVSLLGELSGAIAHEINNPLAAILANAQAAARFLARTPIDTKELTEICRDIVAECKRVGEVIQRLRALFKKTDKRIELVNINEIVADVLELAKRKLHEGNVIVATKLADDVPEVRADPIQLKQVLLNIVMNACDAMEDNKPEDRSLTIATSYDKATAQVSVRDRGSGIPESVKERLFQPFVTTKSSGTGLGLSICRSIVEAHSGRLSASNNTDRGATFSVTLPVHAIDSWGKAGDQALRRSAFREAISYLAKAIEIADKTREGGSAAATALASASQRLKLQTSLGHALMWSRGWGVEDAKAAFNRARELATAIDDPTERFTIYYGLWAGNQERRELGAAREIAETFLREAEREGRTTECGVGRRLVGWTCVLQGDFIGAQANFVEALSTYDPERDREARFRFGMDSDTAARAFLAITKWLLGEVGPARALMGEAVAHALEAGHLPTLVNIYWFKAHFEMIRGDAVATRRDARIVRKLGQENALAHHVAAGALQATWASAWLDGRDTGATEFRQALANLIGHGGTVVPFYQGLLAEIEAEGDAAGALIRIDEALALAHETSEHWSDAFLHRLRGEILLKHDRENTARAEDAFLTAIAVAQQQKARSFELRAALGLARLYNSEGRSAAAPALLASALEGFSPTPEFPEIEEAQALLGTLLYCSKHPL